MSVSIKKNSKTTAIVDIGDATFYIYGNKQNMINTISPSFTEYHIHTGFEIQYINSGRFTLNTEIGEYTAEEGNVIVIPPNHYHQGNQSSLRFSGKCFSFSVFPGELVGGTSEYLQFNRILSKIDRVTIFNADTLKNSMSKLVEICQENSPEDYYRVVSLLTVFLMDLLLEFKNSQLSENQLKKGDSKSKKFNHVTERQRYIVENCLADHFADNKPTEIIEEALNMSKRNASRVVFNLFGKNISDLVLDYRMKIAKMYMENTDMMFNEIAERVGYKTYVAFFTAFKKFYGVSPKDFIEQISNKN